MGCVCFFTPAVAEPRCFVFLSFCFFFFFLILKPDRLSSAPGLHRRGHAELPCSQRPGAPGAPALLWTVVCAQEDLLPAGAGHAEVGSRGGAGRKDAEPRKGGEACACPAPATLHAPQAQSGKLRWRWWRAPVSGAEDGETRYLRGPPEQAE